MRGRFARRARKTHKHAPARPHAELRRQAAAAAAGRVDAEALQQRGDVLLHLGRVDCSPGGSGLLKGWQNVVWQTG